MRKAINILSIVGIAAALIALMSLYGGSSKPVDVPTAPIASTAKVSPPFEGFPMDVAVAVNFDADGAADGATRREQRDQWLDWLLLAVLSDSGLSEDKLNAATFDLPPSRQGYFRPVANFEYGMTRSRSIGDGKVVALVPATASAALRSANLAQVFDEHRKNLGEAPRELLVFEYHLAPERHAATVTHRAHVAADALLGTQYGYVETTVKNLADLQRFVTAVDDVTYANLRSDGLLLGGRRIASGPARGARVEDVAALWQSERAVEQRLKAFEAKWQPEIDAYNARWAHRGLTSYELAESETQKATLEQRRAADLKKAKLVFGSGFSLDPQYDFDGLSRYFADVEPILEKAHADPADATAARDGLAKRDVVPLLVLLDKLRNSSNVTAALFADLIQDGIRKHQFQSARYDGELAGTAVGMNLFYTDLLAKLWLFDYQYSASRQHVEDFRPATRISVSPVFRREIEVLTSTRLWFGEQDRGFQMTQDKQGLLFARNAARVFAASSNPLQPGKETEASADSEAFLGWWNDHYEEVAGFEPEYERLNQIMKWSVLVSWLNSLKKGDVLGYLADVQVKRDYWFPDWVKQQPQLRFRSWDTIQFHPRGYKGTDTETMPLLVSYPYELVGNEYRLFGGVSLASKETLAQRAALKAVTDPLLRRSNVDYAATNGRLIKLLKGPQYEFSTISGRTGLSATARDGAKLRTRAGELAPSKFERTMLRTTNDIRVESSAAGKPVGDLRIGRTPNGFDIGWKSRGLDSAQAVARRASRSEKMADALLADRDVDAVLQLPGRDTFAVRLKGSDRWVKLQQETEPSIAIGKGWDARVSDPRGGVRNVQLALVEDARSLHGGLDADGFLVVDATRGSGKPLLRYEGPKAQAPAGTNVSIELPDRTLAASADAGGKTLRLRWGELAKDADPLDLARRVSLSGGGRRIPAAAPEPALARNLRGGDYRQAARTIAADPKKAAADLKSNYARGLDDARQMRADGQHARSIEQLDQLMEIYGRQSDLLLQKAVTQIERDNLISAAEAIDIASRQPVRNTTTWLDEISARMKNATPRAQENLARTRDYVEWRDMQQRGVAPPARLVAVTDAERIKLHYHPEQKLNGEAVAAAELGGQEGGRPLIYVQDAPGLNNIDWSAGLKRSLAELPSGEKLSILRIANEPISRFRPDVVYLPEQGVKVNLANKANGLQHVRGNPNGSDSCQDSSQRNCNGQGQPAYVVLLKP